MKICIAGAGAIGCTLAARLASTGHDISVLARGQNMITIASEGIYLKDLDGEHKASVQVSDQCTELGKQDLILVCTKAPALPAMLQQIQPMLKDDTVVIPVVNGIPWWYFYGADGRFSGQAIHTLDPAEHLASLLPIKHVIGCVVFITAQRQTHGKVIANNPHLIVLGELCNEMTPRLENIRALFEQAGIESRATDNIRDQLWTKVAANLTSNPLSVVTKGTLDQLYSDTRLQPIVRGMLNEVMLTAAAYGARIRFDPDTFMELGAGMGAIKTSMLQDYEAGQPLETHAIGLAVLELAKKVNVPMPITQNLLSLTDFIADQRQSA